MKADKKDKFKDLLKVTADDKPSANFTASIMNTIEADVQRELTLKNILQKEEAVGPSFSFTANVMAGIQASKPQFVYKPIITKKAWYGIAALLLAFITIVVLTNGGGANAGPSRISGVVNVIAQIPLTYLATILAAVVLLAADYLVGKAKATNQLA